MAERGPRKVEPKYSVNFYDSQAFHQQQRRGESPSDNYYSIPFRDKSSGSSRLAVVVSEDRRLVSGLAEIVIFGDIPQTEDTVRATIKKYSTRYPVASSYSGRIICEEPSCISYNNGGCTNSNVQLQDGECAINTYCLTYEPKK